MESWRKNLYILWATQLLAMVGMNLVVPFLPFYVRELGITDPEQLAQWSGIVFAAPFLTAFIATPFWGAMGDKHGQKLMVIRAIFGLGVSQILQGFSQDAYQLLFFRILQGGISGFIASVIALVSSSTPKEKIGYALGILQSSTAGGLVLGPAVGGFLADLVGFRSIFFVVASLCFIGGFVIIKFVHESPRIQTESAKPSVLHNIKYMFSHPQLRTISIVIVLSQGAALMIEPIFALFIESFKTETRYVSTLTGIIFAIAGIFMVISSPWWGRRNDRVGYKKNLIIALTGTGIAYGCHIIVPHLIVLGFIRALLGFARGGILHTLFSLTNLHAPSERKSGLIGIASSLSVFGNMLGPLAGGWVAGNFGITYVFVISGMIFFLTIGIVSRYLHEIPRSSPDEISKIIEY